MANAKKRVKTETFFTLELNKTEAAALRTVLERVGGRPAGVRGIIDGILQAVIEAGVEDRYHDEVDESTHNHSIFFK